MIKPPSHADKPYDNQLPLLLLCGGQSRRMGSAKPLLTYDGQTLIELMTNNALPHRPVWLAAAVAHYQTPNGVEYLLDALPNKQGPLPAILPALKQAQTQGFAGVYVLACDTLLLPENVIARLALGQSQSAWREGVVALGDEIQLHPLLAYWSSKLATPLERYLAGGGRRVMHWLEHIPHHCISMPSHWAALSNFNTPDAFERAITTLRSL